METFSVKGFCNLKFSAALRVPIHNSSYHFKRKTLVAFRHTLFNEILIFNNIDINVNPREKQKLYNQIEVWNLLENRLYSNAEGYPVYLPKPYILNGHFNLITLR